MITNFFIPELNNHDVQELWFQQDGATCHTSRATIDLLKDTFGDRLISRFGPVNWSPRPCDLTPLDYFLWGYVKSLVYEDKPQTLDHLEDNIHRVIANIRPQMLEKVIENWTSRLDYIRASRGSPMPEIIFKIYTRAFGDGPRNFEPWSNEWTMPELAPPLLTTTPLHDEKQRRATGGLIKEFQGLFSRTSEDVGRTRLTKHRIDTGENPLNKQDPRRLLFAKQEEVQKLINDMTDNDVIEPSSSPWASPIASVRKKDSSTIFCVDYSRLNDVTKKDSYPVPRIDDTLDTLAGNTWFST
ncbi:retrovirus-related Pol polyprotein from transposon 412 [Trichonephila clavipes]|nr:retrovirus-related Pol polyprotein from transposon 412 [Trichonephila clavipes]